MDPSPSPDCMYKARLGSISRIPVDSNSYEEGLGHILVEHRYSRGLEGDLAGKGVGNSPSWAAVQTL